MKQAILIALVCILLFTICSCGNAIEQGEVYKKEYKPAYTTVTLLPMTTGKTIILIPYIFYYPERYVIYIQAEKDGEMITEDFYVSKEVYDALEIGDMYSYNETRGDLTEEPYTKEKGE